MGKILLTGASGQVGQAIQAHYPSSAPHTLLLATRRRPLPSAKHRYFDFADLTGSQDALREADILFLLRPPQLANVDTYFTPLIERAVQEGIRQVLFLSVQGADQVSFIPHAKIEKAILGSGLPYTFLRPSYFMQNLSTTLRTEILEQDRIFLPAGQKPFLWIDVADIGAAIARVLAKAEFHSNQIYTLTGPDLLPFGAVAHKLTQVLNRPIRYQSPSVFRYIWYRRQQGDTWNYILVMILLHYLARFQPDPKKHSDLETLIGGKPSDLQTFLEQHRSVWEKS